MKKTLKMEDLRKILAAVLDEVGAKAYRGKVCSLKECADHGAFDPPCAYAEVRSGLGYLQACSDGEIVLYGRDWFSTVVEPPEGPYSAWRTAMADRIVKLLRDGRPEGEGA